MLLAHLTAGGFYDHALPPERPSENLDTYGRSYGPRVPLLALGPFAKPGYVSHVRLEISSLTKFIEWNWFGAIGQLGARDQVVNNIGDLLSAAAGPVPSEQAAAPLSP